MFVRNEKDCIIMLSPLKEISILIEAIDVGDVEEDNNFIPLVISMSPEITPE